MRARRSDAFLDWTKLPEDTKPDRTFGDDVPMSHPGEMERGLVMPVQLYPMFETALRAAAGEAVEDHQAKVSELWARFAAVAVENPYAWSRQPLSAEEIRTPGPDNRMIGFPYPKYMNSNNDVDLASALLLCTAEKAEALGVPRDRWVFPHAGTDCHDHYFVSERDQLGASPAVRIGGRRVLELAGTSIDDVEVVDLYSCFPSAVQVGAAELGLGTDRQLTRTGGLSFAGGPWNNYVGHAIATVVQDLRARPGSARPRLGQRRLPHQALLRRLQHRATGRRVPPRSPAGRDRRPAAARAGRAGRRGGTGGRRGLHRHALARGLARDRVRRLPASRRASRVGHVERRGRRRRAVRG